MLVGIEEIRKSPKSSFVGAAHHGMAEDTKSYEETFQGIENIQRGWRKGNTIGTARLIDDV